MSNAEQDDTGLSGQSGNTLKTVTVELGERRYDISIGAGLLPSISRILPMDLKGRRIFILADENVADTHAQIAYEALKAGHPADIHMLALPQGEATKSFDALEKVMGWMLDHNAGRDSVLIAVGGGVIGDLGGFAAGTFMRGITYIQVPTTLLALVDSSVGGKTAINMPQGKNMVGVFHQPAAVIADIDTLSTLPDREMKAGYAEVLKYGLINDPEFFIWLERQGDDVIGKVPDAVINAIETACRKKAEIVEEDEREGGVRALLNLGHTFAHALEAAAGYDGRLLHGEAVAVGMVLAFRLSARLALCEDEDADRVEGHISSMGLPTKISMIFSPEETSVQQLLAYMEHDKKVVRGHLTFIVVNGIGKAHTMRDVNSDDVAEILKQSLEGA